MIYYDETDSAHCDDLEVPTDLLDLHVQLEEDEISPEDFKEAFEDGVS